MLSLLPLRSRTTPSLARTSFRFFSTEKNEKFSDRFTLPTFWETLSEIEKMELALSTPGGETFEHPDFLYYRGKANLLIGERMGESDLLRALEIDPNHAASKELLHKIISGQETKPHHESSSRKNSPS
jgi:hypothetical protein